MGAIASVIARIAAAFLFTGRGNRAQIARDIAAARQAERRAVRRTLLAVQRHYVRELKQNAPVRTGALRRSIKARLRRGGSGLILQPEMLFYGFILDRAETRYHGWIDVVHERMQKLATEVFVKVLDAELIAAGVLRRG